MTGKEWFALSFIFRKNLRKILVFAVYASLFLQGYRCFQQERSDPKKMYRGPMLLAEPASRVDFSNNSGAELKCEADGLPLPRITWHTQDGKPVSDISSLRYVREDSTLVFSPFPRSDYRQEVHDSIYRCKAENSLGMVLSRDVHVRGVVQQKFSPQVYDDFVVRGNTAVLRCHLPSFAREHVVAESWILNDHTVLQSDVVNQEEKYAVLPSGELLLYDVDVSDGKGTFRCRARHRLSGETVLSATAGKVFVTEPHSPMTPRITFSLSQIRAEEGSDVRLPCAAQAQPPPHYSWLKETTRGMHPVSMDSRMSLVSGTLRLREVRSDDAGKYQCVVKNSVGEKRTDTLLLITATLKVALLPERQTLNIGEAAVFNCSITGRPLHSLSWLKDGRPLVPDTRVQLPSREVLHITNVRREDAGMYQCFAFNDQDSAQGTSELRIGEVTPYLLSVFPETTAEPGEFVSLRCVTAGNSLPRVTWRLDGNNVGLDKRYKIGDFASSQGHHLSSYLNITSVKTNDGGEYTCEAKNEVGSASHSARLNVRGNPFVRPMQNVSGISGRELVLKCPYGGHPLHSIAWQKGGINLPLDHRQKVSTTGVLTIQNLQRAADEGEYTCIVKGLDSRMASRKTFVNVLVAPVIDATVFKEAVTANFGSRTKIICSVTMGDLPITFQWLKNGFPFSGSDKTSVTRLEDSSLLLFRKVKAEDRGQYTCIATNSATSTNLTTHLTVNVPSSWISEPTNTSVVLGRSVWLDCAADGFPSPTIVWRKARGNTPGDFGYVHSSSRVRQYNNGTLVLWDVEIADRGFYLCQVSNGIGASLGKVIFLDVQVPPQFEDSYQSRAVKEGEDTILKCTAKGNMPISISWTKDKVPVHRKFRYSFREVTEDSKLASELMVSSAAKQDSGMFGCTAVNEFGSDEASFQLIVQGVPDPPNNLTVTNVTSRTIALNWDVPFNGNSHITGSSVQYKTVSESWKGHTSQLIVSGGDTRAVVRGLQPITTYQLRVIAENTVGKSRPSDILNVTTAVEAPSAPPRELSVHPTGDQSLKVSWKPPREESRHGQIQGYQVGYRAAHSLDDTFLFKTVDGPQEGETHSTYVTGLQPFTRYEVVVRAFNAAGRGPASDSVLATTLETAPPTSPILQVSSTATHSVDIKWEKDSKDKSSITEYTLHYKPDDGMWQSKKLRSTTDKYTLQNLKCGTRYHMYLTASNSLGTGEPSLSVSTRTKGAAPLPAPQHSFISANRTSATLHLGLWQNAGCPIQHFRVQWRPKHHPTWLIAPERIPAERERFILAPLATDREYVVSVAAHSQAGVTQADYQFRTLPSAPPLVLTEETPLVPGVVKQRGSSIYDLPFHRNVALVIPVVVSSLVLIIVIFTVVLCFRRYHTQDSRNQGDRPPSTDVDSQKGISDSLLLTEVQHKGKQSTNGGSHYSSPVRGQQQGGKDDHRRKDKQHEYAEPYTAFASSRQRTDESGFATIKRAPPRSGSVSSAYKPGFS